MQRDLLGISDPNIQVDHINDDTLDCQRHNLRIASPNQNRQNLHGLKSNNTSGFRGVSFRKDKKSNQWRARIYNSSGKRENLGDFSTAEAAAKVFDRAARKYYGEFAGKLNFPEES